MRSARLSASIPYWTAEHALLEQLARRAVRFLGGVRRDGAGLLCEGQIRIAGLVGRLHRVVAGQRGGDSKFLLRPIDVGDAVARRRLDQPAQPDSRAEDELRIARLIAPGARAERRQDCAIAAVLADGEIVQPHLRQRAAQLAHRRHRRIRLRHLAERVVAQVEPAAFEPRPGNVVRLREIAPSDRP